jgi:hypothetical protein
MYSPRFEPTISQARARSIAATPARYVKRREMNEETVSKVRLGKKRRDKEE